MNGRGTVDGRYEQDPTIFVAMLAIAGGLFVSAPALLLGMALAPIARRARAVFAGLAVLGIGFVVLSWHAISLEMRRAQRAGERHGMLMHAHDSVQVAWPHIRTWWLLATPLCFAVATTIALAHRKSVEELRDREERRADRARHRTERRARRRSGMRDRPRREPTFALGHQVCGDEVLPTTRGRVRMPIARLARTLLVIGAPGSGKTVTLGRLAYGVATTTDWQVIVIDAKGDPDTQAAFAASMHRAGRTPRLFPQQTYDAWRGDAREITGRLVQLIDWAEDGPGAYYRDISVNLVRLACTAPGGPPRSSGELLQRFDKPVLATLWAGHIKAAEVARIRDEHIDSCRQRYRSFFDATDGQLDGDWAWEDSDCAYMLLNELLYAEETSKLARLLVEDFKQYLASRKKAGKNVLLIIDEFSAIADGERTARMVETVRSYGAAVVLAPQCYYGMGGDEASARILNAAHTVILHAVPDPEPIIKAAGTKMATEHSVQHERGLSTDVGSTRAQHQMRVDPNDVRRLREGMCFVIGNGRAQKIQIKPAPGGPTPAPSPNILAPPPHETDDDPDASEPMRL